MNSIAMVPSSMGDYRFAFSRNTILTSSAGIGEVVSLCFDTSHELLWACNSLGKVASYFGSSLEPYTSFTSLGGAPRAIDVIGNAVILLLKDGICAFRRRGLILYDYTNDNMEDLTCICSLPSAPNCFVLSGHQRKIIQMDLETQKEQRLILLDEGTDCLTARANDKALYTTDSNGQLVMRSIDSMEVINIVSAHNGGIYDFDVSGHRIITCGFTKKGSSSFPDPFLKIYDARNLKAFQPYLMHHYPAVLCRFANSFSDGRVLVGTKYGQMLSLDLNDRQTNLLYQSCEQAPITSMHVSSSRQCASIGDASGCISLFLDREMAAFNVQSWPVVVLSVEECLPPLPIDSVNSNLACIPTPLPSDSGYCSDIWPEESIKKQFRKPKLINPQLVQSTRSVQSVSYAKNPNANTEYGRLNICPYEIKNEHEVEEMKSGLQILDEIS